MDQPKSQIASGPKSRACARLEWERKAFSLAFPLVPNFQRNLAQHDKAVALHIYPSETSVQFFKETWTKTTLRLLPICVVGSRMMYPWKSSIHGNWQERRGQARGARVYHLLWSFRTECSEILELRTWTYLDVTKITENIVSLVVSGTAPTWTRNVFRMKPWRAGIGQDFRNRGLVALGPSLVQFIPCQKCWSIGHQWARRTCWVRPWQAWVQGYCS